MNYLGYPQYQESNAVWLGRIPSHWKVHRLKWSVTGCSNGVWGTEPDGVDDVVCVRVADFNRETLTVGIDSLTNRAVEPNQLETRKLQRGDLLLEKSGGGEKQLVGCVVYFDHDFDAVCSNFVARMPIEPMLSARYWCYVHAGLYAGKLNYPAIKQSTGIQNLDANEYLNTLAAYPPADEQQQIAAFLDWKTGQIDALIAKKKELLEKLKEKRLAVITQAVTKGLDPNAPMRDSNIPWLDEVPAHWDIRRLKFAASAPLKYGANEAAELNDPELPRYIRITDVKDDGNLHEGTFRSLPLDIAAPYLLEDGDILLARSGATVGKSFQYLNAWGRSAYAGYLIRFRADLTLVSPRFAYYFLRSELYWASVNSSLIQSTIQNFSAEKYADINFVLPPLEEQKLIVQFLEVNLARLEEMQNATGSAIARLTEYRTALITAATTGKIDVRQVAIPAPT